MNTNRLIKYALNTENKLMFIDDVPNGLECGCVCPGCKEKLIAKNDGKIREHHFAHTSNTECVTGYQTMIHLLAKAIIAKYKMIPGFGSDNKLFVASQIGCEIRLDPLNIIPDIIAVAQVQLNYNNVGSITSTIPFIIEIYVTHKVDEEKAKIIKAAGIPAIEIDLSKSEATTEEELIKDIYNSANWNYINREPGPRFVPSLNIQNLYNLFPRSYYSRLTNTTPRRNNYRYKGYYRKRR
jgi:hypothetical protein